MEPTSLGTNPEKGESMSLPVGKPTGSRKSVPPLDLYEAGDELYPQPDLALSSWQTWSRSTSTLPSAYLKVKQSGWVKPTIQLAMLLWLERQDNLTVGGKRRLHRLLSSQTTEVQYAAFLRSERIGSDPSFGILAYWVNRPYRPQPFHRKEKRRIGVGYRDKGSTLPHDKQGQREGPDDSIFLGEQKQWIWSLQPEVALLVQDYGYLLNHIGSGRWLPDHRLKALMALRSLLAK